MLFDEPNEYFAADGGQYYQQGDIILAPTATLEASGDSVDCTQVRPEVGEELLTQLWDSPPVGSEPEKLISCVRLCPAMITTHDCTLDKEFNRVVRKLRAEQVPVNDAVHRAAGDLSLDRYINIAPIVPFENAAPSQSDQLTRNTVVGYFPVCADGDRGVDGGVVDLLNETTINRDLIVDRLAIVSPATRSALRYAIARYWVFRAPKIGFELEDAIGKRIVKATINKDQLGIELVLNDGSTLTFIQAPHVEEAGVERPGLP